MPNQRHSMGAPLLSFTNKVITPIVPCINGRYKIFYGKLSASSDEEFFQIQENETYLGKD